ncbi:MAG: enoyl-CoA hydratase/isomerase family protein [Oscillospiraceae bacterium]|jgi:enoyl-CoA hydratase|nr:enoyl-CoA hydratase/isomerase family protein [Oscillospiraceae bacterium]
MPYENIIYSVRDTVATIALNRPEAYNALNSALNRELRAAIDEVEANRQIRALIVTGSEKAFAAGADIGEMAKAGPNEARGICSVAIAINDALEAMPIPTIAAVNGLAWGGGCELALACDFRVGGPRTSFKLPEVSLGIIPGANGTQRLLSLVGAAKTKEIVMLCRAVKGEEAFRMGLLTRLAENDADVLAEANKLAEELKAMPGKALAAAKSAVRAGALGTIEQGKTVESAEFCLLFDTHDQKEGMAAFAEKRTPNYTNR